MTSRRDFLDMIEIVMKSNSYISKISDFNWQSKSDLTFEHPTNVLKQVSAVYMPCAKRVKFMISQQCLGFKPRLILNPFLCLFQNNFSTQCLRLCHKYSLNLKFKPWNSREIARFVCEIWYTFNYDCLKCRKGWELWFLNWLWLMRGNLSSSVEFKAIERLIKSWKGLRLQKLPIVRMKQKD